MWFLGAVAGLVIGGLINGWPGALGGAILGVIAGVAARAVWGEHARPASPRIGALPDPRIDHIFRALRHIHLRLEEIEKRLGIAELPPMPEPGAAQGIGAAAPEPDGPGRPNAASPSRSVTEPPQVPDMPAVRDASATTQPATAASRGAGAIATGRRVPPPPATSPETPAWWRWAFGGNTLVRLGVVILFFGVAFLVKYATENFSFPIELRLAGVAASAIVMLAIGWRLRERRVGYALAMQGGGIGVLYLTVFAALRLYALMPPSVAFALLLGVVVASVVLALRQDALSLAMLAVAGGFLAPILASTGQGSHVMLFGYYVLLNLGILAIAWRKAWRPLNVLGFAFTFAIGALWGARFYRPAHFATTEPFLIAFFLIYVGIAVLYALRRSIEVKSYVDGTLVFGTPLIAFGLQSQLVRGMEYALAFSALALAALYVLLATTLWSRRSAGLRLLVESFLALGVAFGTLAIPLALDGRWTSAAWALEGAAITWAGARQGRRLAQWFGVTLQFAAGAAFLAGQTGAAPASYALANSFFLGCAFLAVAGLFCANSVRRHAEAFLGGGPVVAGLLFFWGAGWWLLGGLNEIDRFVASRYEFNAALAFLAAAAAAASAMRTRLDWRIALVPAFALLPAMALLGLAAVFELAHPFARYGWLAWPFAFAVLAWILRRHEAETPALARWMHVVALWLAVALTCWETAWWIDRFVQGRGTWPLVAWALVPALVLLALAKVGDRLGWPVAKHPEAYLLLGGAPMAVYLWCWVFLANVLSDGNPAPLPYAPLLNPLDLAMAAVLVILIAWYLALRARELAARVAPAHVAAALGLAGFAWANGMLLRTLHHWASIPYRIEPLLRSTLVQTAFSVFWTVLALGAMLVATRRGLRAVWFVGAALLGVVVCKLFLVDLSRVAGIERIVSFIVVGVLLLAVGYFSPVPPRQPESRP